MSDRIDKIIAKAIELGNVSASFEEVHIYNHDGLVDPPTDPGTEPPTDTDLDPRPKIVVLAVAKTGKIHVILWIDKAPVGALKPQLDHPDMADREFVPHDARVLIVNEAIMVDGGGTAFRALAYGSDADLAAKGLDGQGLYIKATEFRTM